MVMDLDKHKIQSLSLIVALIILITPMFNLILISKHTHFVLAGIIIAVNAYLEWVN